MCSDTQYYVAFFSSSWVETGSIGQVPLPTSIRKVSFRFTVPFSDKTAKNKQTENVINTSDQKQYNYG